MPAKTNLIEKVALRFDVIPTPVLDYVGALGLRTVCLAEHLGVFQLLEGRARPAGDLARQLQVNERGMRAVLDALEAVGYLRRSNGDYALTSMAAKWMPRLRDGMKFFESMAFDGWPEVETHLKSDETVDEGGRQLPNLGEEEDVFGGALSNARFSADEVVKRVRIGRGARRLLDVGGGHGLYSAKFCRRYPQLRATLFDFGHVLKAAEPVLAEEGVADRVELRAGDFWTDDLGSDYDVALVFNLLNGYPPENKVELLRRVAAALAPKGTLVVLDQMRHPSLSGTAKAIVQLTNLRLFDPRERDTYSLADMQGWLESAGLRPARAAAMYAVPWMSFVVARKSKN